MSKAFEIANKARVDISDFCINTCKAKCCRVGKLLLQSKAEVEVVLPNEDHILLEEEQIIEKTKYGNYTLDLDKKSCSRLTQDYKCGIHKDPNRPSICSDYPIFFVKSYFMFSPACTAVQQGLLDKYIKEIEEEGYKFIK